MGIPSLVRSASFWMRLTHSAIFMAGGQFQDVEVVHVPSRDQFGGCDGIKEGSLVSERSIPPAAATLSNDSTMIPTIPIDASLLRQPCLQARSSNIGQRTAFLRVLVRA
jgi:hypothetical protein